MSKKDSKPKKISYDELENYAKRLQADFENYKKRTQIEKEAYSRYANTDLILQILPVLDNFQLAIKHLPEKLKEDPWVLGVKHIETQLEQILLSEGLTKIPTTNEKFDPNIHEAVEEVESEKPPGTITHETQTGYQLNGKIIRHSKVKVSREKEVKSS